MLWYTGDNGNGGCEFAIRAVQSRERTEVEMRECSAAVIKIGRVTEDFRDKEQRDKEQTER